MSGKQILIGFLVFLLIAIIITITVLIIVAVKNKKNDDDKDKGGGGTSGLKKRTDGGTSGSCPNNETALADLKVDTSLNNPPTLSRNAWNLGGFQEYEGVDCTTSCQPWFKAVYKSGDNYSAASAPYQLDAIYEDSETKNIPKVIASIHANTTPEQLKDDLYLFESNTKDGIYCPVKSAYYGISNNSPGDYVPYGKTSNNASTDFKVCIKKYC